MVNKHSIPKGVLYFGLQSILFFFFTVFVCANISFAQNENPNEKKVDRTERDRAKDILKTIKADIKSSHYDLSSSGLNLDERFQIANEKIDQATSVSHLYSIITQAVIDVDPKIDFYPPPRNFYIDFGVFMRMIGDKCYVIAVKPGSDAEAKGAKPGDEIVTIDTFRPTRSNFHKIMFYYEELVPRNIVRVLVKRSNEKELRPFDITGKVVKTEPVLNITDLMNGNRKQDFYIEFKPYRLEEIGKIMVVSLPGFYVDSKDIGNFMKSAIKSKNALVLDLRGSVGVADYSDFEKTDTVETLAGYFFDEPIKIADLKGRKETKIMQGKPHGKDVFNGKLIVLIDTETAPGEQIFARLIQLKERGIILGDSSLGMVSQKSYVDHEIGNDRVFWYGLSIPTAKVIMPDGKTLENEGVMPDEKLLPTGGDLALGRDPVLARALELAGAAISAEQAGKFFPVVWRKH